MAEGGHNRKDIIHGHANRKFEANNELKRQSSEDDMSEYDITGDMDSLKIHNDLIASPDKMTRHHDTHLVTNTRSLKPANHCDSGNRADEIMMSGGFNVQTATRRMMTDINLDALQNFYSDLVPETKSTTPTPATPLLSTVQNKVRSVPGISTISTPHTSYDQNPNKSQNESNSFSVIMDRSPQQSSDTDSCQPTETAHHLSKKGSTACNTSKNSDSFGSSNVLPEISTGFIPSLSGNCYSRDNSALAESTPGNYSIPMSSNFQFGGNSMSFSHNSTSEDQHSVSSNLHSMHLGTDTGEFQPHLGSIDTLPASNNIQTGGHHFESYELLAKNTENELQWQDGTEDNETSLQNENDALQKVINVPLIGFNPNPHHRHQSSSNQGDADQTAMNASGDHQHAPSAYPDLNHHDNTLDGGSSKITKSDELDKKATPANVDDFRLGAYLNHSPPHTEVDAQHILTQLSDENHISSAFNPSQSDQFGHNKDNNNTDLDHTVSTHNEAGFNLVDGLSLSEGNNGSGPTRDESNYKFVASDGNVNTTSNSNTDDNSDVQEPLSSPINPSTTQRDENLKILEESPNCAMLSPYNATEKSSPKKYDDIFKALDRTTAEMNKRKVAFCGDKIGKREEISDSSSSSEDDEQNNKVKTDDDKAQEIRVHSTALTIYDCQGKEPAMFSALLCVAPQDIETFGLSFLCKLKSWGFRVFLPEKDLILTGPKYENLARVIIERCNCKVIVVVSKDFPTSKECLFLLYFARQLDPAAKEQNIVPIYIDKDIPDLPNALLGLSSIRYNQAVRNKFLQARITAALRADTSGILNIL